MLGSFILPFFIFSWFIGIFGLMVLFYRVIRLFIVRYLSTLYSVQAETAILRLSEINLTPNILLFFGLTLVIFSFTFTMLALRHSKEEIIKDGVLNIFIYMFFYLLSYPLILIISLYKFSRGKSSW